MTEKFTAVRFHFPLLAIIVLGLFLRVWGLNWDDGLYLHPDERFIAIVSSGRVDLPPSDDLAALFDAERSPLNPRRIDPATGAPYSFAYGTLPVYVQSAVAWLANLAAEEDYQSYQHLYKVGRLLTVLLDTITIWLVYLVGKRLFRESAGLVGAALYALAVLPIQLSHFFTVDVWLTTFVTASLWLAIRYVDSPTAGRALALALPVGCAFATKASVASLVVPLLVAASWVVWKSERRGHAIGALAAAGALSVVVFSLFEPYALVNRGPFIEDIRVQARIVRGEFDVPFTRQFVGLTPGLYELRNHTLYSLGPGLVLAGLGGTAYAARRLWRLRDPALAVALAWIVAYTPILLSTEARFLRYSLPLVPILAALAGGALTTRLAPARRIVLRVAATTVLIVTAIWGIGFTTIYAGEHPRVAASAWMAEQIPAGSRLASESWDDTLPLPSASVPPVPYSHVEFRMYDDAPPEEKARYIAETLIASDYVILSSDRLVDSVDNLPWRYAVQNEYYRRLLNGQLGYQLVYEANLRPELFGVRYDDSAADESFTVYDHPRVRIFRKVEHLSVDEIRDRLLWGIAQPWEPQRYPSQETLLLDISVGEIETTGDAGWNSAAKENALVAIVVWLVAVELIGLAAAPLAALALRRAPDRGAFSARLLGLLALGWVGWIAGSLGFWQARTLNIALALAVVGGASWALVWRRRRSGATVALPTRRAWGASFAVWLGLFAFFVLLRAIYPDFWQTWFGGEKPFELAYLRAVAASVEFPPYDPWYADGVINYYYYGWHLLATLIKLSGVGVSHGFQLGSATFAALLGLQLAGLGSLLASRGLRRLPRRSVAAGAAAVAVAVLFIGNLDALRQVIAEPGVQRDTFDFWRPTRVIDGTINEFPYFSEIWADVHPHVMNFPAIALLLTLLAHLALASRQSGATIGPLVAGAVALTLGTIAVTNSWDAPLMALTTLASFVVAGMARSPRRALISGVIGAGVVAAAFLLFLPFYSGFYSVVEGLNRATRGSELGQFLTHWGIFFGVVALASAARLARMPSEVAARDGLAMGLLVLVGGTLAEGFALATGAGLPERQVVIALLVGALVVALAGGATRSSSMPPYVLGPLAGLSLITGLVATGRPAATVALAVTTAGALHVAREWRRPSRYVPWAFVAIGAVTVAATEFVYVADDLRNSDWERMNTVFKFYLQAWILLGAGAGVLLAGLWRESRLAGSGRLGAPVGVVAGAARRATLGSRTNVRAVWSARIAAGAGTLLLSAGLLYPLVGTPVRLDWKMETTPDGLTLDGYAWMDGGSILNGTGETIEFSGDMAAIEWLNANADRTDVILEGSIGPYRGNGGRISSATGRPAILGWDRHQRQQRYEPGIAARMSDVRAIYNETDPARKLEGLRRYRTRYVIVGDIERFWNTPEVTTYYASAEGLAAFDMLVGAGLALAFEAGSTTVYEVLDFPAIAPAPDSVHDL